MGKGIEAGHEGARHVGQHGRLIEQRSLRIALSARQQARAAGQGIGEGAK